MPVSSIRCQRCARASASTSGRFRWAFGSVSTFGGRMISLRPPQVLNSIGTRMSTVWPSWPNSTGPSPATCRARRCDWLATRRPVRTSKAAVLRTVVPTSRPRQMVLLMLRSRRTIGGSRPGVAPSEGGTVSRPMQHDGYGNPPGDDVDQQKEREGSVVECLLLETIDDKPFEERASQNRKDQDRNNAA